MIDLLSALPLPFQHALPPPLVGPVRLALLAGPVAGGAVVYGWRLREVRRPLTARRIVAPPLGMATGLAMFWWPPFQVPLPWALAALALGATVFAEPLVRSARLERAPDGVRLRPSPAFALILLALLGVRLALREWIGAWGTPLQTAGLVYLLALGMIARWRAGMLRDYRRLARGAAAA